MTAKKTSIRFQLNCLLTACIVPVWLFAAFLVHQAYKAKLEEVNRDLLERVRALTMAVDKEVTSVQAALLAVATSPSFPQRDLRDVHRQAKELLKFYLGADVIVADSTGQQLVNSYRPYGSPLPKRNNPALVRSIFRTGMPVTSDLFLGAVTKRPLVAIDVPVFVDGRIAYDLSMTFSSERLSTIISNRVPNDGSFSTILDRNGVIVARTRDRERFVGNQADPEFRQLLRGAEEGVAEVKSAVGVPVLAAFRKSAISGWTVAYAIPKAVVMADIYKWTGWAVGGAAGISLIAILLGTLIARRIAGEIQSLLEPAHAIGRGETVTAIGATSVRETSEVAEAMVQASSLLQRRSVERELAERQLSRAVEELKSQTAKRLSAMEELRRKEQMLLHQGRQAAMGEMIGNIAHQWRQPLNALGLLVQQPVLFHQAGELTQEFLEQQTRKSMEIIQHMSRTIDDFRNFFKPDKEKVRFRVGDEVAKTLSLIEGSFHGKETVIEVEKTGDPVVYGYPNEYCQVLLNILINSRDAFAERNTADPKVRVALVEAPGRAVVTITDNAGGIAEEILPKVFDPYFTTKGPQVGTGLGLFMSKTIIEKNMGGVLTARNVENGAEFRIEV